MLGLHRSHPWRVDSASANLLVEDTELDGNRQCTGGGCYGIGWSGYTARRVYVHDTTEGFNVADNVVVEDSYLAHPYMNGIAHPDGFQSTGGSNATINHNHISWGDNSAVILKADQGSIANMTVSNNLMDGTGHYLFYDLPNTSTPYGTPTNISFVGNVIGRGYQYGVADYAGSPFFKGNTWLDNGHLITPSDPGGFSQQ